MSSLFLALCRTTFGAATNLCLAFGAGLRGELLTVCRLLFRRHVILSIRVANTACYFVLLIQYQLCGARLPALDWATFVFGVTGGDKPGAGEPLRWPRGAPSSEGFGSSWRTRQLGRLASAIAASTHGGMTLVTTSNRALNRSGVGRCGVVAGGTDLDSHSTTTVPHTDAEGPQREAIDQRIPKLITWDQTQAAMFGQNVLAEPDDVVGVVRAARRRHQYITGNHEWCFQQPARSVIAQHFHAVESRP